MLRVRSILRSLGLITSWFSVACAHGPAAPCPVDLNASHAAKATSELSTPAWIDSASLPSSQGPLALYDVRWLILTGDSGAFAGVPSTMHNFTLGRWECALSGEKTSDSLADNQVRVDRTRRLVCTHATGVTAQSELQCAWQIPSNIQSGSPKEARREMHLTLSDAPPVRVSCEPEAKEPLPVYQGERGRTGFACVVEGQIKACPAPTQ